MRASAASRDIPWSGRRDIEAGVRLHIFVRADRALLLAAEEYEADCPPRQEPGGLDGSRRFNHQRGIANRCRAHPCPTPRNPDARRGLRFRPASRSANLADDICCSIGPPILLGILRETCTWPGYALARRATTSRLHARRSLEGFCRSRRW